RCLARMLAGVDGEREEEHVRLALFVLGANEDAIDVAARVEAHALGERCMRETAAEPTAPAQPRGGGVGKALTIASEEQLFDFREDDLRLAALRARGVGLRFR